MTARDLQQRPRTRANRVTMPIPGDEYVPTMSQAERAIVAMLEHGLDPLTVCRAIRNGDHLRWRAPMAVEEAA